MYFVLPHYLMLMQLILVRPYISLGVALTLILSLSKAINPCPIPMLICVVMQRYYMLIAASPPRCQTLMCRRLRKIDAVAVDVNTSVGVGDRRLPTASFDSARKTVLVTMISVCCIIICCHCCGVRKELHLVYHTGSLLGEALRKKITGSPTSRSPRLPQISSAERFLNSEGQRLGAWG